MIRYFRLYLHFIRFALSKAMEFRIDFFFRVIMDIGYYIIDFIFFEIIYLHTPLLGHLNLAQAKLFIASTIFIDALDMTLIANGMWAFPQQVNTGELDYHLTRPVSSLFMISLKDFAANSVLNVILATGILVYQIWQYPFELDFLKLIIFILLLFNGVFIGYLLHMLFLMSTFWTQSPRGLGDLFYSFDHVARRPDSIYKGFGRHLFIFILPFSLMASYPLRFLLQQNELTIILTISLVTIGLAILIAIIWSRGLKSYQSASS